MESFWFAAIAVMLAVYVVLDGFDLGAGVAHLVVARDASERTRVIRAIGPFWDGNEVWLIAAVGALVFAFPRLYAAGFSGFFLPLTMVLWLLMGRGIALEFRNHLDDGSVWRPFWDGVFGVSSALLAVFLGTALGNVVRGVPLSPEGTFFEPLFTDFRVTGTTGIVDWFTLLVGLFALSALSMHGGLWLVHKTTGELKERSRTFARRGLLATATLVVVVCVASWSVQPQLRQQLGARPAGHLLTLLAAAGLVGVWRFSRRGSPESWDVRAFLSSCLFLASLLGVTTFSLYPLVLPSNGEPALGLTVHNAAAPATALVTALYWWVPGMGLAAGYTAFVYRRFRGRIDVTTAPHGA
jgi:cytochrome d ubiquinol oxidase subunit II